MGLTLPWLWTIFSTRHGFFCHISSNIVMEKISIDKFTSTFCMLASWNFASGLNMSNLLFSQYYIQCDKNIWDKKSLTKTAIEICLNTWQLPMLLPRQPRVFYLFTSAIKMPKQILLLNMQMCYIFFIQTKPFQNHDLFVMLLF